MSIVRISSLAILLMLPIISQAEGGGDRVIERYEKMRDARIAERAKSLNKDEQPIAEQNAQREGSEG